VWAQAVKEAPLDRNNHQGWYGEYFIQALAAAAGFIIARPLPDLVGADLLLLGSEEWHDDYPFARVQVKSWSRPKGDERTWNYRITEKQFNALAGPRRVPAFLFLVLVPRAAHEYAQADADLLRLNHAAYWVSLADRQKVPNPGARQYVTIAVPRQNLLTVDSLNGLFTGLLPETRSAPNVQSPSPLASSS
jgi:hypothetical protein